MRGLNCLALTASILIIVSMAFAQSRPAADDGESLPPTHADVRYGPHERNLLDFWQAKSSQPTPLLVSIHGGGFLEGNKSVPRELLHQCLDAGISVAAISYRYSSQAIAPASFQDSARAVQFLRHQAKQWNIDTKRVAATGSSAGAGMSLWLGFHADMADSESKDLVARESTRLTCMAAFDGQSSYDPRFIRKMYPGKDVYPAMPLARLFDVDLRRLDRLPAEKYRLFEEVSAINLVTKDAPPVLLTYDIALDAPINSTKTGMHHPLFGKLLHERMDALGVACELVAAGRRLGGGKPTDTIDFLKKHLGRKVK